MVYESDFYTTRRPYTRPISSHYTITNPGGTIRPMPPIQQQQVRMLPHHLPYIAHKKLVNVIHTPYPVIYHTTPVSVPIRIYSRLRPSVIAAELQRIRNLSRPYTGSYVAKYLNSKDHILFDDETRDIRARADDLLRRIHVYVPRPSSSDFAEVIVPERMRSDDYIRRVLTARKNAKRDEEPHNWYEQPETRQFGTGNLAAVAYVGGKPHSRRRPYYKVSDLRAADVQSDVNMLSFYAKNRQAAASAYPDVPLTEREIRKARALADEREYVPRKASPDPEPVYKPDMASVYDAEEVVKPKKKTKVAKVVEAEPKEDYKQIEVEPVKIPEPEPAKIPEPEPAEVEVVKEAIVEPTVEQIDSEPVLIAKEVESEPQPIQEELPAEVAIQEAEPSNTVLEQTEATIPEPVEEELPLEPEPDIQIVEEEEAAAPVVESTEAEVEQEMPADRVDDMPELQNDDAEENEEDNEVLQRKLDEEELRRQVEELKRQAEEEKRRLAEEARLAEERWKAEIEERVRLEEEARQARLREIEEQERLEAERQAEEARLEAQRLLEEQLAEEEKRAIEAEKAAALEEQERYVIEKAAEEARKRQEREEKLSEVALTLAEDEHHHESTADECHCHDNVTSQELEERPGSPDADDDTQIEEEAACISTDHDDLSEQPYDGEHEGFNSKEEDRDTPIENSIQIDEDFCFNNEADD